MSKFLLWLNKTFSCPATAWSSIKRHIFLPTLHASWCPRSIFISLPALISIADKVIVSTFDQGSCGSNIITLCEKIFYCPTLDNKVANETSYRLPCLKVGVQGWYLQTSLADTLIRAGLFPVWSVYPPKTLFPHLFPLLLLNHYVKLDNKVANETSYFLPLCKLVSKVDIYIISSSDQYSRQRHCFHIWPRFLWLQHHNTLCENLLLSNAG